MVRTGRPRQGANSLARYANEARDPALRALLRVAVDRKISLRHLATLVERDEAALSRSLLAAKARAKTIGDCARALGFPVLTARALAGAMTEDDLALIAGRAYVALFALTESDEPSESANRVRLALRELHDDPSRRPIYIEALAAFVLGGAGLRPEDAAGSPWPADVAALVAALRRRGYDVGTPPTLNRTRLRLAEVGLTLVDIAIGLGDAENGAIRRALGARAQQVPRGTELAAIVRAAQAAEDAALAVLEQPGLEDRIQTNQREISAARLARAKGPTTL